MLVKLRGDAQRQVLLGKPQLSRIMFVDNKLREMSGNPTKTQRIIAKRLLGLMRRVVYTQSFEYLIYGAVNNKSELRKLFTKSPTVIKIV